MQTSVVFDSSCTNWQDNQEHNLLWLHAQEKYLMHLLEVKGYLSVKDVYDQLSIPVCLAGQTDLTRHLYENR